MFSNEGLDGGGQWAQKGGKMAGTGGRAKSRALQAEDGYGANRATDLLVTAGWVGGTTNAHTNKQHSRY